VPRILALDHLESKAVTAWVLASPSGERVLWVARAGAEPAVRLRGRPVRDLALDPAGQTALLLVEDGDRFALEHLVLDGDAAPRRISSDLATPAPELGRSGDDAILLTDGEVLAISWQGAARSLFRRDDASIKVVARNPSGSLFATRRAGNLETVDREGNVVGTFGHVDSLAFLEDDVLAYSSMWVDEAIGYVPPRDYLRIVRGPRLARAEDPFVLDGRLARLRPAGSGALSFQWTPWDSTERYWLLHPASRIVRSLAPSERGALRVAARDTTSRPMVTIDDAPIAGVRVLAKAEPETHASGFFVVDGAGVEARTAYERSGWDDGASPEEARVHQALLDRFLAGLQWPLVREPGYEPFFASDDEPLRTSSSVRHLGLDLGARMTHSVTGSVAFHAEGARVHPIWRGGSLSFDVDLPLREGETALGTERFRILHRIELREGAYLLRVHAAYEHVEPLAEGRRPSGPVTGSEAVGGLEAFSRASPGGGWQSGDAALVAHGIGKGNHVHLGIGGIYGSFNTTPEAGARKLRWYRERLIPAFRKASGPK
jgi:hypothetical protein